MTIQMALLVASLVIFIIAAIGVPAGRFNLIATGLAAAVLSVLIK